MIRLLSIAIVLSAALLLPAFGQEQPKPSSFPGVYKSEQAQLILAPNPNYIRHLVGYIIFTEGLKVYPVNITDDPIKGCGGVVYDGSIDHQRGVRLKLDGDILSFSYNDCTTLKLVRQKAP